MKELASRVAQSLEELLVGGLTTTSQASLQILESAFLECARLGLLRLGLAVRGTAEELRRYCQQSPDFSQRRLQALQVRAWLLARAILRGDERLADRAPEDCAELEVVGLGVEMRVVAGGLVAFDWRLRQLPGGRSLLWSSVSAHKPSPGVPLEAFMAIPLKQGFAPSILLQKRRVRLEKWTLAAGARLSLTPESRAHVGPPFQEWASLPWEAPGSRWRDYRPTPLDNDNEPQEEALLDGVFSLVHYRRCQRVVQPLSRMGPEGPEFLTIDPAKVDAKLALKAFSFGKDKRR